MRKIQCETCALRGRGVICDVPPEARDEFRAIGTTSIYRPRQVVFSEGAPATGLYLLCHGLVKLYSCDRFGAEHILDVANPGAVLGELPLDGNSPLSVSAEALTESQICSLPRERLVAFLKTHPTTGIRLIEALSGELASARRKVRDLALKDAQSRMAGLLLQFARANGDLAPGTRVHLRYTRQQLAEMIGVSTETAIRLLAKLNRKRLIRIDRRDILIADAEGLAQVANYDEAEA